MIPPPFPRDGDDDTERDVAVLVPGIVGRTSRLLALCWSIAAAGVGCGGSNSGVNDCPSYVVVADAGVSGFSSVGEWRTDEVCAQYCQADYWVCQLATATSVKCQEGCQ